jgi:hypothetical protein
LARSMARLSSVSRVLKYESIASLAANFIYLPLNLFNRR